jgi:hypothetical protein
MGDSPPDLIRTMADMFMPNATSAELQDFVR